MSGAFSALQAMYAARRVATYPVTVDPHTGKKKPAVAAYQRVGAPYSRQLALKFPDIMAAGFCAGPRNRITVVDIDSTDDRLVDEIQRRYGITPLQVVTPSGGRHLYYRHDGEARRIRPLPDVDILGAGNVVAALSEVPKGRYAIERGSLDDLDCLPKLHTEAPGTRPAKVEKGQRNVTLFQYCRRIVAHCDTLDQLMDAAETWARDNLAITAPAVTDPEIAATCSSVWQYRGGRKRVMQHIIQAPVYASLVANTDALALFAYLSAENGTDAEFMVADGLSKARGWSYRFVPAARKALLDMGIIECIRPAKRGQPALYRWTVGDERQGQ